MCITKCTIKNPLITNDGENEDTVHRTAPAKRVSTMGVNPMANPWFIEKRVMSYTPITP
jgi:hypothetical protein